MQKAISTFIFTILINYYSIGQDGPTQWNIQASYSAGFQYFNFNGREENNHMLLKLKMPIQTGFFHYDYFKPTVLQQIEISATVFKNKNWYIGINRSWGRNEINSYGYYADASNNTIGEYRSKTWFNVTFIGYSLKKNINLKQLGMLQPFISFYVEYFENKNDITTDVTAQVKDNTTGQVVSRARMAGSGGSVIGAYRAGILSLLDNPKIGVNYFVKVHNHVFLTFSYSYWWANTMVNDFYGIADHYVIPFKNSHIIFPSKSRSIYRDLFSSNLSIGLTLSLRK